MRNLMVTFAALAFTAGIVAAIFWRDLHAERQLNTELQARLNSIESRRPEPVTVAPLAAVATTAGEVKPVAAKPARPRPPVADVQTLLNNQRDMLKDPEYHKARLAQLRLMLPQSYPGLVEALGLSPAEADKLFDLLAESQLKMDGATSLSPIVNGQIDQAAMQEAMRVRQEMQAAQNDAVLGMLGSAKYAQWQDYQQTRPSRMQATTLSRNMESAGQPLTAAQMEPLTSAFIAEQKRQLQDRQAALRDIGPITPETQEKFQEENFRLQAERNRRIADSVASSLNPRQLETLKATLDQQLTMSRISSRLARQQAALQAQSQ